MAINIPAVSSSSSYQTTISNQQCISSLNPTGTTVEWSGGCACGETKRYKLTLDGKCNYCKGVFKFWSETFRTTITSYPQLIRLFRVRSKPTVTKT